MKRICTPFYRIATGLVVTLLVSFAGTVSAETLNPEGINPHQEGARKRITTQQKKAAWEAKKKKMAEIESKKASRQAGQNGGSGAATQ